MQCLPLTPIMRCSAAGAGVRDEPGGRSHFWPAAGLPAGLLRRGDWRDWLLCCGAVRPVPHVLHMQHATPRGAATGRALHGHASTLTLQLIIFTFGIMQFHVGFVHRLLLREWVSSLTKRYDIWQVSCCHTICATHAGPEHGLVPF